MYKIVKIEGGEVVEFDGQNVEDANSAVLVKLAKTREDDEALIIAKLWDRHCIQFDSFGTNPTLSVLDGESILSAFEDAVDAKYLELCVNYKSAYGKPVELTDVFFLDTTVSGWFVNNSYNGNNHFSREDQAAIIAAATAAMKPLLG